MEFNVNRMRCLSVSILLGFLVCLPSTFAQNTNVFELRDGDRVVFLGDTLIEREQSYGYIEFLLTTEYPERNVTFRNLGWSADTPLGVSRAGFDPPEKGPDTRVSNQHERDERRGPGQGRRRAGRCL